jgi:ribosomal protein L34E
MRCSLSSYTWNLEKAEPSAMFRRGKAPSVSRCATCGNSLSSLCKLRPFKCYTARHRHTRRDRRQYVEMMSRLIDATYAPALSRKLRGSESFIEGHKLDRNFLTDSKL